MESSRERAVSFPGGSVGGKLELPRVCHSCTMRWGRENAVLLARLTTIAMMTALIALAAILAWYFTNTVSKRAVKDLSDDLQEGLLNRTVDEVEWMMSRQLLTTGIIAAAVEDLYARGVGLDYPSVVDEIFRFSLAIYRAQAPFVSLGCVFGNGMFTIFDAVVPEQVSFPSLNNPDMNPGTAGLTNRSVNPILPLTFTFSNQTVPAGIVPIQYFVPVIGPNITAMGPVSPISANQSVDYRQRQWYKGAVTNPSGTAGQLLMGMVPAVPLVASSIAVYTPDEALVGVCKAGQSLVSLSNFLASLDLKGGLLYMTDRNGVMVASSSGELTSPPGMARQRLISVNESLDRLTRQTWVHLTTPETGGLPALARSSIRLDVDISGTLYYVNTAPIPTRTLPLIAVLVVPRASIVASIDNRNRITLVGVVVSCLVLCLVGCLAVVVFTGPASSELRRKGELKEKAEEESKTKSQFLSNCSHELRTPMAAIMGLLELVLEDELSSEQLENVLQIRQCAQGLLGQLNDLLDLGKIEAGKMDLELVEFDLEAELESLLDVFSVQYRKKGVELALDLADREDWMVKGDPARVRQIFSNLVSNSFKFTPAGGQVVVRGWQVGGTMSFSSPSARRADEARWGRRGSTVWDSSNVHLAFQVDDTGCGIPAGKRKKVFESFTQADASTTRVHGGTGLGMTIVSSLVSLMGGSIGIDDKPGPGTLISFDLRFAPAAAVSTPRLQPSRVHSPRMHTAAAAPPHAISRRPTVRSPSPLSPGGTVRGPSPLSPRAIGGRSGSGNWTLSLKHTPSGWAEDGHSSSPRRAEQPDPADSRSSGFVEEWVGSPGVMTFRGGGAAVQGGGGDGGEVDRHSFQGQSSRSNGGGHGSVFQSSGGNDRGGDGMGDLRSSLMPEHRFEQGYPHQKIKVPHPEPPSPLPRATVPPREPMHQRIPSPPLESQTPRPSFDYQAQPPARVPLPPSGDQLPPPFDDRPPSIMDEQLTPLSDDQLPSLPLDDSKLEIASQQPPPPPSSLLSRVVITRDRKAGGASMSAVSCPPTRSPTTASSLSPALALSMPPAPRWAPWRTDASGVPLSQDWSASGSISSSSACSLWPSAATSSTALTRTSSGLSQTPASHRSRAGQTPASHHHDPSQTAASRAANQALHDDKAAHGGVKTWRCWAFRGRRASLGLGPAHSPGPSAEPNRGGSGKSQSNGGGAKGANQGGIGPNQAGSAKGPNPSGSGRAPNLAGSGRESLLPLWSSPRERAKSPSRAEPGSENVSRVLMAPAQAAGVVQGALVHWIPSELEGATVVLCMRGRVEKEVVAKWLGRRRLGVVMVEEYAMILPTLIRLLPQLKDVPGCQASPFPDAPEVSQPVAAASLDASDTAHVPPPSFALALSTEAALAPPIGPSGSVLSKASPHRLHTVLVIIEIAASPSFSALRNQIENSERGEGQGHKAEGASDQKARPGAACDPCTIALMRLVRGVAARPDLAQVVFSSVIPANQMRWFRKLHIPETQHMATWPLYGSRLRSLLSSVASTLAAQQNPPLGPAAETRVGMLTSTEQSVGRRRPEVGGGLSGADEEEAPERGGERAGMLAGHDEGRKREQGLSLQGLLVLVAEDTVVLQRLAVIMLTKQGAQVVAVSNGQQAVDSVLGTEAFGGSARDFDAVLMDCQMPYMDGYDATRAIRRAEHGRQPRLPIIALTAHAMPADRLKCLEAGMDEYHAKPVNAKVLAGTLEHLCARTSTV